MYREMYINTLIYKKWKAITHYDKSLLTYPKKNSPKGTRTDLFIKEGKKRKKKSTIV